MFNFLDYNFLMVVASNFEGDYGTTSNWNLFLGAAITIAEVCMLFAAFIIIIVSIVRSIMLKNDIKKCEKEIEDFKDKENEENKLSELNEQLEKLKTIQAKRKKKKAIVITIVVILILASTFIQESRQFAKPIIYIYPKEETKVSVKLGNEDLLSTTYPKYENGWNVLAKPNGDLVDLKTNRNIYSLYWEGGKTKKTDYKEGFVVKGEDTAKFLEEKLEILGLNDREIEEFIIYWLPIMEENNYNYIEFLSKEEINDIMPIEIDPKPDTLIRVFMQFKGLNSPINTKEQKLVKVERNGYTVVEWGGAEL